MSWEAAVGELPFFLTAILRMGTMKTFNLVRRWKRWRRDSYNAKVQKCLTGLRKSMTRVNDEIRYLDKENPLNGYSLQYHHTTKRKLDKNIMKCLLAFKYEDEK